MSSHTTVPIWTASLSHPMLLDQFSFYWAGDVCVPVQLPRQRDGSCELYAAQEQVLWMCTLYACSSSSHGQCPVSACSSASPLWSPKGSSMCSCRGFAMLPQSLGCWSWEHFGRHCAVSGHPYGAPQASWSIISESAIEISLPGWLLLLQLFSKLLRQWATGLSWAG